VRIVSGSPSTTRERIAPWVRRFYGLPRPARFAVVGLGGIAIGFVVYNLIYWANPFEPRATISWAFASVVGVWRQHGLHRLLTFQDRRAHYATSLGLAYVAYSIGIVGSTALNWWLTQFLNFHHLLAWLLCVASAVVVNYFLLERVAFRA
jgi:putative flippase GtrA